MPPQNQHPGLKPITSHLGHEATHGLLKGIDDYLNSGGSLNQLRAFIYGEWMPTKDGGQARRTGTGWEYYPPAEPDEPNPLYKNPTYPNCSTCDGGGCGDCS